MSRSVLGLSFLLALQAFAGEYALFSNGSVMRVDRHEVDGSTLRLYLNGGTVEFSAASVTGFVPEVPAPAAKAAPASTPVDAKKLVDRAARQYGANKEFVKLVHSVAKVESGYREKAVSPKGAVGLMQLMPSTAQALGADPQDPEENADAGARYLRDLLVKYNYDTHKALAAYNAGPGAVDRYKGVPPYRETIEYIEKVIHQYYKP